MADDLPPFDFLPSDEDERAWLCWWLCDPGDGLTPAEYSSCLAVRCGFLGHLITDDRTIKLFETWAGHLKDAESVMFPLPAWAHQEAEAFLRSAGCSWPWLSTALVRLFSSWLWRVATDLPLTERPFHVELQPNPSARGRLRFPKAGDHLFEWGTWFYRVRVRGEKIRALAQERHRERRKWDKKHPSHVDDNCGCRRTIQVALKKVKHLLNSA